MDYKVFGISVDLDELFELCNICRRTKSYFETIGGPENYLRKMYAGMDDDQIRAVLIKRLELLPSRSILKELREAIQLYIDSGNCPKDSVLRVLLEDHSLDKNISRLAKAAANIRVNNKNC